METVERDEIIKIYDRLTALHEWAESLEDLILRVAYEARDSYRPTNIQDAINDYHSKMENL
jgi:hypothetical protein